MADIEQPQPAVVPEAGGAAYAHDTAPPGAVTTDSPTGWIKTPKGILRIVQLIFGVVTFACMADVKGFDYASEYEFLVAVGVLVFLYALCLIMCYTFRRRIEQHCLYMPPIELMMDGIFCVLLLAAGAAAAAECDDLICKFGGKPKRNTQAAIVFCFFTLLTFVATTFLSYRENAAEEAKR